MSPTSKSNRLALVLLALSAGANSSTIRQTKAAKQQAEQSIEFGEKQQLDNLGLLLRDYWLRNEFNKSSSNRFRRQSEGRNGSGPIGMIMGLYCPSKSSESDETESVSAEILLHRTGHKDDISIAESNSDSRFESAVNRLLENADFQRDKPTLIYLPGWLQSARADWLLQARKALDDLVSNGGGNSTAAPVNLMIVDYTAYNSLIYARTVSMVPLIGQALAHLLQQLIDKHAYSASKIHIVSYSLSTHIAGVAGRLVRESGRGQLAQITAIDPTGVCFHLAEHAPFNADFGLRPGDAKLVLARHYNMQGLGAGRPIGGVDVFVNGGERQPRMSVQAWRRLDVLGSTDLPFIGHLRAILHEVASSSAYRPGDCQEIAYKCASFKLFKQGQCADCGQRNESCLLISTLGSYMLGLEPQKANYVNGTQMHLMTGGKQFCTHNYQVVARLKSRPPISVLNTFERGQARFELMPGVDVAPKHKLNATAAGNRDDGSISFTALLRLDPNQMRLPERIGCPTVELFDSIVVVEVNFMSSISPAIRRNKSTRFCPEERAGLKLVVCR